MSDFDDEFLPGDKVSLTGEFTVASFDGYGTIETQDGYEFDLFAFKYTVDSSGRPDHWPPENHDVWKIGHEYVHVLDENLYDEYGSSSDLDETLSELNATVKDMTLVFRPGVVDASAKSLK